MLPGLELMGCPLNGVPGAVMHHVVKVESSFNRYAIGVVGGHLVRQPRTLGEALATVRMLEERGFNFSLGLAQVNRYNLAKYGVNSYEQAFSICPNLRAGSEILAECRQRSGGHWGKAFSCYYSGNFTTGYRQGYVQKIERSMWGQSYAQAAGSPAIQVIGQPRRRAARSGLPYRAGATAEQVPTRIVEAAPERTLLQRRGDVAIAPPFPPAAPVQAPQQATTAAPQVQDQDATMFQPQLAISGTAKLPPAPGTPSVAVPPPKAPAPPPSHVAHTDAAFVF